ncbi:MAG: enoyl-CoA hydratase/isomerase family protein [Nocardioides sp.]|uniref:enoyl-CoA hydratase/isomerase family protein n=1 Tax=Nocardioides sp. TaxID=35761 RepID=UPI0039E54DB4
MTTTESFTNIEIERFDLADAPGVFALVRLNRPDDMNPLDFQTAREMRAAFDALDLDPEVRTIGITGNGRAFSAGGDMKGYVKMQHDIPYFTEFLTHMHEMFLQMGRYDTPVIALVNGVAVAGGFETVIFSDVAIMAESARIGDAHLPYGMMGGGGVLTWLPRLIGPSRARELIFSGRLLSSAEALEWGLVSKVVPDDELIAAGIEFATSVAKKSPLAIKNAKRVMNSSLYDGHSVVSSIRFEREATVLYCGTSEDAQEGLAAFNEKRSPRYTGR